jgi:hypothetical protein
MEQCTVETGLLKKKPCGQNAVAKCANCEQPLCTKHAIPQMSAGKKAFLCPECAKAWKQQEKTMGALPDTPAAAPGAKKPAEAPKPAAAKAAPAAAKPAEKKPEPPVEHSGPLEFTPEPKKPDEKK